MDVRIMYRNSYVGGDGWQYGVVHVTIADNCPICGAPRGAPRPHQQCEDGEWFTVDVWENSCGHLDSYREVWHESQARAADRELVAAVDLTRCGPDERQRLRPKPGPADEPE